MAQHQASSSGSPKEGFQSGGKAPTNKYAVACATLASMNSTVLGYDIGVMSGAAIFIKEDLGISDVKLEILLGIINIYSLVGSALAGRTSDWIGRRYTIVFAAVIFFIGAILMGFAANYAMLMVGRFVAGIGIGYALMIAPVYTAEVAPSSSRGLLSSFPEIFVNFGILLGYVSNYAFQRLPLKIGWRLMLGVGAAPAFILGISVLTMPESPRWLVMQGRIGDAKKVLDKTSNTKQESDSRLADIKAAVGIPAESTGDKVEVPQRAKKGEGVWGDLFLHPTPAVRRVVIAGLGIHFFQQATGVDAVVLYSPRIFAKAGITQKDMQLAATVAVGAVKTAVIIVSAFIVDKFGRRPLLLISMGGMCISLVLLSTGLTIVDTHPHQKLTWAVVLCVGSTLAYVAVFSIGMGPITWVYSSEIFPIRLRAQGCGVGVALNRTTSGVISMTFLSLSNKITIGGAFFLFAGMSVFAWIFFFTFLPETRGKNLEDMDALFGDFRWRESLHSKEKGGSSSDGDVQLANKA